MLKQNVEYQEKDPSLASSLYLVEKTYIAKQVISMSRVIEGTVPYATDNLKNQDTETKDIRPHRVVSVHCIFWGHVATASGKSIK